MGTEVLRPQDCLIQRIRVAPAVFHRRKNYYGNGIPKVNNGYRKPAVWSERRRSPEPMTISKRSASVGDLRPKQPPNNSNNNNNNKLVVGQVTILRRGESLDRITKANEKNCGEEEIAVYGTDRLGPDPKVVLKQVRLGLPDSYAGSAFSMSPSPRKVPLPSFFNKKEGEKCIDDSATRDLRRLLRLD